MSSSVSWNAVVVPSTPLMLGPLGTVTAQIGTPASSDAEITTQVSRSVADPLGEVRELALEAVCWLVAEHPSRILVLTAPADPANVARGITEPLGERVARSLLSAVGYSGEMAVWAGDAPLDPAVLGDLEGSGVLVVGDGSARRGEKAPGHLDERSFDFDTSVEKALRDCDAGALCALDDSLGSNLLAAGVPAFRALGSLPGASEHSAVVDYADDPLGVQYWIVRWTCAS
ncbi:hypothetical protein ASG90_01335 [Nocardioides sp. Soil797]|nr:hypothetical protein ASG90_01335 [Nocardioides sp. Soil797]